MGGNRAAEHAEGGKQWPGGGQCTEGEQCFSNSTSAVCPGC